MRAVILAGLLMTCVQSTAITDDDVITQLTLRSAGGEPLLADGVTLAEVQVCVTDDDGRDPKLTATLRLSRAAWVSSSGSDPSTLVVSLTSSCETRQLILPNEPGPLTVTADVAGFVVSETTQIGAAPVSKVSVGVLGALSATAWSTITLNAALEVANLGLPSTGTPVEFTALVEPLGAAGYLSSPTVRVEDARAVQTSFTASPAVTRLTVTATALPLGQDAIASSPVTITR